MDAILQNLRDEKHIETGNIQKNIKKLHFGLASRTRLK